MIERLCIIGVGLIGGSLARALREAGYCRSVVGAGRKPENLRLAVELGVIDSYETDLARAVAGADMVLVAVPLGAMEPVFSVIRGNLDEGAVLTDAGSAKVSVIEAARRAFGEVPANFVPGHPIAGIEQSGVAASLPDLYRNRRVILTPLPETAASATRQVRTMWEVAGTCWHSPWWKAWRDCMTRRKSLNTQPAVFAILPVSPPVIPSCGATSVSRTALRSSK
jgi:prephenate dehydrogenase